MPFEFPGLNLGDVALVTSIFPDFASDVSQYWLQTCLVICVALLAVVSAEDIRLRQVIRRERRKVSDGSSALEHESRMRRIAEESQSRYLKLVERSCDFDAITDLDGGCLYLNAYGKELIGIEDDHHMATISIFDVVDGPSNQRLKTEVFPALYQNDTWTGEMTFRHCDTGEFILCDSTWMLIRNPDDEGPVCVACTARDVTQSITDKQERRRLEGERKRLIDRLVEVQEAERRRIARDLHDELGQVLTGLKLTLERGKIYAEGKLEESLVEAGSLVQDAIRHIRELALELRPAMLDDIGLIPALKWHFEKYSKSTNLPVHFEHDSAEIRTCPRIETAMYRIVQEALTNIARHSGATQLWVTLERNDEEFCIIITDDGKSFDPELAMRRGLSTGLAGMRERTQLLGGKFHINSSVESGTTVEARFPLTEPVAEEASR